MVNVVVAVVRDALGRVLLSQRQAHQDFAHHWEFPGGKVESGETVMQSLQRELREELAIECVEAEPLITIPWQYEHKSVCLHAFTVTAWQGEERGVEGQALRWFEVAELSALTMPAANRGILAAIRLPSCYAITGAFNDLAELTQGVSHALAQGAGVIQLRSLWQGADYVQAAESILPMVKAAGAQLLLNTELDQWRLLPEAGLHLSSQRAAQLTQRPVPSSVLLSVSVHNEAQLQQAQAMGADCVLLSPVLPTQSHPDMPALGWQQAAEWVAQATIPVYALGGVSPSHLVQAKGLGFQGVAAIGAFWSK
jgi:8-oxo-dGTP diphosphatase